MKPLIILNIVLVNFNDVISKNLKRCFDNFVNNYTNKSNGHIKFIYSVINIKNLNDSIDMCEPVFIFDKSLEYEDIIKYIKKYNQFSHIILNSKVINRIKEDDLKNDIQFFTSIAEYLKKMSDKINNMLKIM